MYIDEATFREIFHKFIYIECPDALEELSDTLEIIDGATGVLAYCFCEDLVGTNFNLLASAKRKENGTLEIGPRSTEKYARVRFSDVRDYEFELVKNLEADITGFLDVPEDIRENFESADKKMSMLRELEMLDGGRNMELPDFVSVTVGKKGFLPEVVWVRTTDFGDNEFYGTLHNPPKQGFGLEPGQKVRFRAYDNEGDIMLILDSSMLN
ncbi:hypothetical protein [Mogibacterium pumilum]|uniref:Uncharacterized protein n=1 Tax=Mogibacterium pumilum TaxID=86332 RepID=A0A223ARF3_9FIRM|nr:hypothetical protein [Mogibacterium pumilum]ASS37540.1 hypothetical protein AXF17_03075 [Mogibacterium pumilum]